MRTQDDRTLNDPNLGNCLQSDLRDWGKTKGYTPSDVSKCDSRYMQYQISKENARDHGRRGQDQERKQGDTYKLKSRNATISDEFGYMPKCKSKSSANRLGLREQDHVKKTGIRTGWTVEMCTISCPVFVPTQNHQKKVLVLLLSKTRWKHQDTNVLKRRYTTDFGSVFGFQCQK